MAKVPRFDEDWGGGMHPDSDGPWIRSEDYDALAARLAEAEEKRVAQLRQQGEAWAADAARYKARLAEAEVLMSEAWRRNESLRARLAEAERDAARYRWLRDVDTDGAVLELPAHEWDASIDAFLAPDSASVECEK